MEWKPAFVIHLHHSVVEQATSGTNGGASMIDAQSATIDYQLHYLIRCLIQNVSSRYYALVASFQSFYLISVLRMWYLASVFSTVNSDAKLAQVFLSDQFTAVCKLLSNVATQMTLTNNIDQLTVEDIKTFTEDQFDP